MRASVGARSAPGRTGRRADLRPPHRWVVFERPFPRWDEPAPAVLTIDVEDYYQVAAFRDVVRREDWAYYPSRVEANVDRILGFLEERGIRSTWFVLGWEARQRPKMIQQIAESGHEIGCHSYWHRPVFELDHGQFREDVVLAKQEIEDACGRPVVGFRAPSFSIRDDTVWAIPILRALGFRYDSSLFPVWHPTYGLPEAPPGPALLRASGGTLWELPPATTAMLGGRRLPVAGGAYWRHFPGWVVRAALRRLARTERRPAVLYLHPWELDPAQPRLAAGWVTRFRHYHNLGRVERRLGAILSDHRFLTASELVEALESKRLPDQA